MTIRGKLVSSIILCSAGVYLSAQDMHFSQATNFPLLINPALNGMYNAKARATLAFRNQNLLIPNTAFNGVYNTIGASFETKVMEDITGQNSWSVGFMGLSDFAGSGTLATNQLMLSSAYSMAMDRYGRSFLSFGAQLGMITRRIFSGDLLFESQAREFDFDPKLPNLEAYLDGSTRIVPSMNLGVLYQQYISDNMTSQVGFSLYNVNKPKDFFTSTSEGNIFSRTNIHVGLLVKLDDVSRIYPSMIYMRQGPFSQTNIGLSYSYDLTDNLSLLGSLRARLGDAYILAAGTKFRNWNIVFSYDITTSSLNRANRSVGALELNLIYLIGENKEEYHSDKQYCPSF